MLKLDGRCHDGAECDKQRRAFGRLLPGIHLAPVCTAACAAVGSNGRSVPRECALATSQSDSCAATNKNYLANRPARQGAQVSTIQSKLEAVISITAVQIVSARSGCGLGASASFALCIFMLVLGSR